MSAEGSVAPAGNVPEIIHWNPGHIKIQTLRHSLNPAAQCMVLCCAQVAYALVQLGQGVSSKSTGSTQRIGFNQLLERYGFAGVFDKNGEPCNDYRLVPSPIPRGYRPAHACSACTTSTAVRLHVAGDVVP